MLHSPLIWEFYQNFFNINPPNTICRHSSKRYYELWITSKLLDLKCIVRFQVEKNYIKRDKLIQSLNKEKLINKYWPVAEYIYKKMDSTNSEKLFWSLWWRNQKPNRKSINRKQLKIETAILIEKFSWGRKLLMLNFLDQWRAQWGNPNQRTCEFSWYEMFELHQYLNIFHRMHGFYFITQPPRFCIPSAHLSLKVVFYFGHFGFRRVVTATAQIGAGAI